jgi:hypothetical protein
MDISPKTLNTLFQQLGLPGDDNGIETFIKTHGPIPGDRPVWEAPFWTESQQAFLRESLESDADWAEVVDELSALLHQSSS